MCHLQEKLGLVMNKSELKSQYNDYTSEYLLELRARGDGLLDIAHEVIEEVMESRGEKAPPRPMSPVLKQKSENRNQDIIKLLGGMFTLFCANVIAQMLQVNILLAGIISIIFIAYLIYGLDKKEKLSPEEIAREEARAKIGSNGFTELMFYASEGNLDRVQDLVNYKNEINKQDHQGATALMYASKNGHESVIKFLLISKANPALKTKSGSTALDFAKRGCHENLTKILS